MSIYVAEIAGRVNDLCSLVGDTTARTVGEGEVKYIADEAF